MAFVFSKLQVQNFMPFARLDLDLSIPGLTVVDGVIEGRHGCSNNGAGKSAIFDAVCWAVYGRCLRRDYTGDDVIRIGSSGGCAVVVEVAGGPEPIRIERYRKHAQFHNQSRLFVGNRDCSRGTTVQTDVAIVSLLGMDFTTYVNSVAFGARDDMRGFFFAADSEKKAILERILGLEVYADAEKAARLQLREVAAECVKLDASIAQTEASLTSQQESMERFLAVFDAERARLQLAQLKVRYRYLKQFLSSLDDHDKSLAAQVADVARRYAKDRQEYLEEHARVQSEMDRLTEQARQAENEEAVFQSRIREITGKIQRFQSIGVGVCPTCTQAVTPMLKKSVVVSLEQERQVVGGKADGAAMTRAAHRAALAELRLPTPPRFIELDLIEDERATVREQRSRVQERMNRTVEQCQSLETTCERYTREVATSEATTQKMREELERLREDRNKAQRRSDILQFWVEGFGNRGLKSLLIEAEAPAINVAATRYAQRLLGDGVKVQIRATRQLKSGAAKEEMTIEASIPGCASQYSGASRAQKTRLDLSLLLAFRDTVSRRAGSPFAQLFVDEVFDGLDEVGTECVAELLEEVSQTCPVLLVTHEPKLKSIAKRVVVAYHREGEATVDCKSNGSVASEQESANRRVPKKRQRQAV